jgi:D-alanyl-D-alanine carboxypeptidase
MGRSRWSPSIAAATIVALLGAPAVAATSIWREQVPAAPPGTPLPACRHDDVPTRYTGRSQWAISLVDPIRRLPSDYRPTRLVSVSRAGLNGDVRVRQVMIDDLRALARAARLVDAKVAVISAYRTYSHQKALFRREVRLYGREAALRRVARAGHSEHQLGTALDFRSAGSTRLPWASDDWARTRPGRWMQEHAWQYGFVMSYPDGERETTCYRYEPWHYRYVGRQLAQALRQSGDSLREYLWEHYETAP